MIRASCEGDHHVFNVVNPTPVGLAQFGVDPNGPLPEAHQEVCVHETVCPLSADAQQQFLEYLERSPLPEDNYGIQAFCVAKSCLAEFILDSNNSDTNSDNN